jgi:hypothetical protein
MRRSARNARPVWGGGVNSRVWRAEGGEPRAESRESYTYAP